MLGAILEGFLEEGPKEAWQALSSHDFLSSSENTQPIQRRGECRTPHSIFVQICPSSVFLLPMLLSRC